MTKLEIRKRKKEHRNQIKCVNQVLYPKYTSEFEAIAIIECKNDGTLDLDLTPGSRQHRRYNMFGLPVLKCGSVDVIHIILSKVDDLKYGRTDSVPTEQFQGGIARE